jgi:hypothetical protein
MKHYVVVVLLLVCGSTVAFSLDEIWNLYGAEFGQYYERSENNGDNDLGSSGFNVVTYNFTDKKNSGSFLHYSFLLPILEQSTIDNYDGILLFDLLLGPGFRCNVSEKFALTFGIGISMMWNFSEYSVGALDYTIDATNLGVGGDIGLKFDITDKFYIGFGVSFTYSLLNFTTIYAYSANRTIRMTVYDDYTFDYTMIGVKPYIGIGSNFYQEKAVRGKPK